MKLIAISLASLALLACGGCTERKALHACDKAIQFQLKAPATYHRVSNGPLDTGNGPIRVKITYDADNELGVPIRGGGYCEYAPANDHASWHEMPAFTF